MAVPRKKSTKARKGKRRLHWRLEKTQFSICPSCKATKLPHRVCPSCGEYKGRKIINVE